VVFVVGKAALAQAFSEYFNFPCPSFYCLLHTHHHPSTRTGTIGQIVADIASGLSFTDVTQSSYSLFNFRPVSGSKGNGIFCMGEGDGSEYVYVAEINNFILLRPYILSIIIIIIIHVPLHLQQAEALQIQ
jgi:hypothetical protein